MTAQRIAVIGVGQMGSAMAERLTEKGYDVLGFDIDPQTRARLEARGVPVTDRLSEALDGRSLALSSLPNPAAMRAAFLGEQGAFALAGRGTTFLDLSTVDPATMTDLDREARRLGHRMIDAPVSGSPVEAREGNLVLIVGGERALIDEVLPILEHLGKDWHHTGEVGTAKVVKIVNNVMSMGNVLVAAEAFSLGTAAGVAPQVLFDVISNSGGRSHHFTKRFPSALKANWDPGFKMELGEKDLALGIELGRSLKKPTPAASMVREMFSIALASGYEGKDIVSLLDMYDKNFRSE